MSAYDDAFEEYLDKGWSVVPVIPGTKRPAVAGITGWFGEDMIRREAAELVGQGYGMAIRIPPGVVAIDIDAYDGKHGGETLAGLEETLGVLPETYRNSARHDDQVSGHRFYRVPVDIIFKGDLGTDSGIEILQHHHRIAVVWPSINVKTGTMYRWSFQGEECGIPTYSQLAEL